MSNWPGSQMGYLEEKQRLKRGLHPPVPRLAEYTDPGPHRALQEERGTGEGTELKEMKESRGSKQTGAKESIHGWPFPHTGPSADVCL